MGHKANRRGFTWQTLTAAGIAFSLLLGIVVGDRAQAQTIEKQNGVAAKSMLSRFTQDISTAAEQGRFDSFTDNQEEITQVIEILSRGNQNNPVILTDSQSVRNVIIAGVARQISRGEVPETLFGRRVLKLDLDALFQDSKNSAELKTALTAILSEATSSDSRIILFIDPIQALVGSSAAFDASISDVVREVLANGSIQCVGASTQATFKENIGGDAQLASLFAGIELENNGAAKVATDTAENQNSKKFEEFTGEKVSAELSEVIANTDPSTRIKVILQVEDLNNEALRAEFAKFGATINQEIPRLGTIAVEIPAGAIPALAANGTTNHVSLDRPVNGLGHVETTTGDETMQVKNVGIDGSGIGVAVLDSGISSKHKSLSGRIAFSRDFTGEGTTNDGYGHGTFVASMIAAKQGPYGGIATGANLINFRVLDSQGRGSMSEVLNALNSILTYRAQYNIRVVNMSLGSIAVDSYKNDPLCRAVRKLVNAGIVVVASAGNDGKDATNAKLYGRIHSPGNEPSAITVGAVNTFGTDARGDDVVTTFSSRGPTRSYWKDANGVKHYDNLIKPDLVAPGNKIIGAAAPDNKIELANPELCVTHCQGKNGMGQMRLSGTSVSAPIVAGAAAVMLEANPNLTPNMIKMILMYTAQSLKGYNMLEQGAGELNIEGAVRLAKLVRTDLSAGTAVGSPLLTSAAPAATSTIAGHSFQWSQGVILNHNWAAGSSLITKYQAIYGEGVLLGDGVLVSDGVLLADLAKLSGGVLLGDNILISNGITMSDGITLMSSGVLVGDGGLLADGVLVGDGVLVADGVVVADRAGVLVADRAGVLVADRAGVLVADGVVVADSYRGDNTNCMDKE